MELLESYIIRQVPIPVIERFYQEIRCWVKPKIPTTSWEQIILNPIGSEQILRSDLVVSECMNPVGTLRIRVADIKGKQRKASESDKR